jgi:nucleolar protein 53
LAELPSESLFAHDTTGSTDIRLSYRLARKPLKADEILAQRSAIPALSGRKRSSSSFGPESKKRKGISHEELTRLRTIAYGGETVDKDVIQGHGADYDPWDNSIVALEDNADPTFSFLPPPQQIKAPKTLKHTPISMARNGKPIPAVVRPDKGKSYNPYVRDYEDLLIREGKKEVEAEIKRRTQAKVYEELSGRQATVKENGEEGMGGETTDEESAWEGFSEREDVPEAINQKRPERKTQAQRNRIQRRKEAARQEKALAEVKRRKLDARHITQIAKDVESRHLAKLEQGLARASDSESDMEDIELRKRRFGRAAMMEQPLELVLPDELQESLRLLKPEGNLLKDRFRSILVRGKVESRRPISQPRKKKVKTTEKWTYKDWTLD